MAEQQKEPQISGNEGEPVYDDIGEEVNRLKGNLNSQHSDFYQSRREDEEKEEKTERSYVGHEPSQKINDEPGGAKRDSFFKRRDYE
ncbi:MAG TPA: hypothetical protein VL284_15995 [Thermoanaerobaculia bacterium]|nr:hypothetical protein [Thermoanaerobaculia bacterium]